MVMFLVEKRDGTIKDRTCSDGIKQRRYKNYNKHDYASPTCVNNSVMITSALEFKEGRDVAIIDTPGAYLNIYVNKNGKHRIIMLFKGKLSELMVMVGPKMYWKYVTYESKGNAVLYVEMNKALYVLL